MLYLLIYIIYKSHLPRDIEISEFSFGKENKKKLDRQVHFEKCG